MSSTDYPIIPVCVHAWPARDRHGFGGEVLDEAVDGLAEGAVAPLEGDRNNLKEIVAVLNKKTYC